MAPVLLRDAQADLLAAVLHAVVEHDLGARGAGVGDLQRRRIGRHDDGGLHAQQARGFGKALRVVARRPADDALLAVGLAHRGQEIVGAAQLERAGALQALGLDEQPAAQPRVDPRVLQQRRADRDALEAAGGGLNIGEGRGRGHQETPSREGRWERSLICGHGLAGQVVVRRAGAVDPHGGEAEVRRAMRIPAVGRQEADLAGRHAAARLDQAIDARIGLEHLAVIDAQHRLEAVGQPGGLHHGVEHLGIAVRQDGEPHAGALQPVEHRRHLGEGIEREIGAHQLFTHDGIGDAVRGEAMIERLAGHLPELCVGAHAVAQPSVLDLLRPPHLGQRVGLRSDRGAMAGDRRVEVEQRAVGVEHADLGAGEGAVMNCSGRVMTVG